MTVLRDQFTPIAAVSDRIVDVEADLEGGDVLVTGEANPSGDLRVDVYHSLAGPPELFASGIARLSGRTDLRSFEARLRLPGPADGNSYVVLYDLGADPSDTPIAMSLFPVDLREARP